MPKNTETKAAEAAFNHSPARAELALRLFAKQRAAARIAELTAADRRLDGLKREAEQLAADVAEAEDSAKRAELALELVTLQARITSAGPEREKIAAGMLVAGHDLRATTAAAQAQVAEVISEELATLAHQVEDLNRQLAPLHNQIAGLRAFAYTEGNGNGDEAHRYRHLRIGHAASEVVERHCPFVTTAVGGSDAAWSNLRERLMSDANARMGGC